MGLTLAEWNVERAKLVEAQSEIQSVIDSVDASFGTTVKWDRTGVVGSPTYSNGDLTVAATGVHTLRSTVSHADARYFEVQVDAVGNSGYLAVGVIRADQAISSPPDSLASVPSGLWLWRSDAYKANNGASSVVGSAWGSGDRIGVAWNSTGVWFRRNGTWIQGDPVAGTGPVFTGLTGDLGAALIFMGANGSPIATAQFASPSHAAPPGFALL